MATVTCVGHYSLYKLGFPPCGGVDIEANPSELKALRKIAACAKEGKIIAMELPLIDIEQ